MFRFAIKQFKIFRTIIVSNPIDMMNFFRFFKIPTKLLFHYKTMFENIFLSIVKRMKGRINKDITIGISKTTHSFISEIRLSYPRKTHSFSSFFREFFAKPRFSNKRLMPFLKLSRWGLMFSLKSFTNFISMRLRHFVSFNKHTLIIQ